ncbi:hypothetical protein V2J09_001359 [Rumex salicifolius]
MVDLHSLIVSWIRNTIEPSLRSSIPYKENAQELWEEIHDRFSVSNGPKIQQLKSALADTKQRDEKPEQMALMSNASNPPRPPRPDNLDRNTTCTHCNRRGHAALGCFNLISYPDWWLDRKRNDSKSSGPTNQSIDSSGSGASRGRGRGNQARANAAQSYHAPGTGGMNLESEARTIPGLSGEQLQSLLNFLTTQQSASSSEHMTGNRQRFRELRKIEAIDISIPNGERELPPAATSTENLPSTESENIGVQQPPLPAVDHPPQGRGHRVRQAPAKLRDYVTNSAITKPSATSHSNSDFSLVLCFNIFYPLLYILADFFNENGKTLHYFLLLHSSCYKFLLLWNFKKDLQRLGKTIETITCFIYDAEQRHSKEHLVKSWLSRLREVLYEADDLFHAIAARALRKKTIGGSAFKKEVTLFFSKSNQLCLVIKTAHEIKAIRESLDGINDDMSPFQLQYQKIEEKHQLQREFRETIQGKKHLLVIDDVWDENASNWSRLKILLNCGKIGSKVLITTHKRKVAQCFDAIKPYYMLNVLSEESAWSLFVEMAFEGGKFDGDSKLVSAGQQILHKCGYVPLAVSMIGRMLRYRKKDKEEWQSFMEKEFTRVVSDDSEDDNLIQVLKVSYNDLPLALKHCFAYCSVFPMDHISSFHSNLSSHSKSLRTLRFIEAKYIEINSMELVLDRFRRLRTLVLSNMKFGTLPNSFGGLIHLRYLDLSHNFKLTALPNSICKLYHLLAGFRPFRMSRSVRSGDLLPRLEVLQLQFIDKLRGWWSGALTSSTVPTLPSVSKLNIMECTSLVENMPLFVAVEHLTLDEVNVRLMNMLLGNPNAQRSPQCHDCNKLQVLELSGIEGLECLSEGSIKHMTGCLDAAWRVSFPLKNWL